jgi:hypothetical protein
MRGARGQCPGRRATKRAADGGSLLGGWGAWLENATSDAIIPVKQMSPTSTNGVRVPIPARAARAAAEHARPPPFLPDPGCICYFRSPKR